MTELFKLISAAHLLLIKNDQILLLRRFNTGYEDGNYSVAAGHLDGNESATQAMVRESLEEAGLTIKADDLSLVHLMHRKASEERVDFFFTVFKWQGQPKIKESHKCDDLNWFDLNNLPANMVPYVRSGIENYKKGIILKEFNIHKIKIKSKLLLV